MRLRFNPKPFCVMCSNLWSFQTFFYIKELWMWPGCNISLLISYSNCILYIYIYNVIYDLYLVMPCFSRNACINKLFLNIKSWWIWMCKYFITFDLEIKMYMTNISHHGKTLFKTSVFYIVFYIHNSFVKTKPLRFHHRCSWSFNLI